MAESLFLTLIGFLSGAVMYSFLIPKIVCHVDVRRASIDENPGSSNVIRSCGVGIGLFCMALDVLKAFIPVAVATACFHLRGFFLIPVAVAPVLGHAFSPMFRFHGGKAVSTAFGSLLALWPLSRIVVLMALIMIFFRFIVIVRPDSSGTITSMLMFSVLVFFFEPLFFVRMIVWGISAILVYRHAAHPDKGEQRVEIIKRYSVTYKNKRLVLSKI